MTASVLLLGRQRRGTEPCVPSAVLYSSNLIVATVMVMITVIAVIEVALVEDEAGVHALTLWRGEMRLRLLTILDLSYDQCR